MLCQSLPPTTPPNQAFSTTHSALRLIAFATAAVNAYLTLTYAQALWPQDRVVSIAVALIWEASLVCFAITAVHFVRQGAHLRGVALAALAASQMAGSAYASTTVIDQRALAQDQAAMARARDHQSALAHIASLQTQITRTLGPKTLAALRAEESRALAARRIQETDGVTLARGYALLDTMRSGASHVALNASDDAPGRVHTLIAIMLQIIAVAAMGVTAATPRSTTPQAPAPSKHTERPESAQAIEPPHPTRSIESPHPTVPTELYNRVRNDVVTGAVGPSNRALQRQFGLGWRVAKQMLERMVGEGLLSRRPRSYQLVS